MNPYGVDTSYKNTLGPFTALKVLRDELPATQGCEQCETINGSDVHWCCRSMNPSMHYVEFLYVWDEVQKWSKSERLELIIRAIRNYLSNSPDKGCVFYKNGCTVYNRRPLMCYMYGIIPEERWNARIATMQKLYGETYTPRPQCPLVRTVDGQPVTKEQEDLWFRHIVNTELRLGVPKPLVDAHDNPEGTYRTFHDHLLIELFPDSFLNNLTAVRLTSPNQEQIDAFITVLRQKIDDSI